MANKEAYNTNDAIVEKVQSILKNTDFIDSMTIMIEGSRGEVPTVRYNRMSGMKLIIDIPEQVVTAIQNGEDYRYDIHTAIAQGKPYEEKPQGEWILQTYERFNSGNELYKYDCNKCGHREEHAYSDSKLPNFCPNCGADMQKGGADMRGEVN